MDGVDHHDGGPTSVHTLRTTRLALHALAEHVVAAALHAATGHIGLRATPGGFGTPVYAGPAGPRQVRVDGSDLVVSDAGQQRRAPLTTLRAAADLVGMRPGAPADVYPPTTPLEPDRTLDVEPAAAARLAAFFATVEDALRLLLANDVAEPPGPPQLWPEHFDLAAVLGEVNYGGSPGDAEHPLPYLYVGPWAQPPPDSFWNEPFGASVAAEEHLSADVALAFFLEGRDRLTR